MAAAQVGKPKHLKLIRKSRADFMKVLKSLQQQNVALTELGQLINELPNNELKQHITDCLLIVQRAGGNAAVAAGFGLGTANDMEALAKRSPNAEIVSVIREVIDGGWIG